MLLNLRSREAIDLALVGVSIRQRRVEAGEGAVVVGFFAFLLLHGNDAFR